MVPCFQHMHILLDEFIKRHKLPAFDFKDLRSAGARAHERAAKSIRAAQQRLNHSSAATTSLYTDDKNLSDHHDRTIRQFQGEFVRLSLQVGASESTGATAPTRAETQPSRPAPTIFGFQCKDPVGGLLPGTRPGVVCLHFFRCATCPGSLVPLDDVRIIARLLSGLSALSEAGETAFREGWGQRFKELYEPTKQILETEVLPLVDPSVLEKAKSLVVWDAIPRLE